MNRNWLSLVMVAAAVAAGTLGGAMLSGARASGPSLAQLRDARWLEHSLGLSPEQAADVARLQGELRSDLEDCCGKHCAARDELGALLFREGSTEEELSAAMDRMCRAQLEGDLATVRHILKIRDILTPEQRARYEKMVTGCVCTDCPHGFEHGG